MDDFNDLPMLPEQKPQAPVKMTRQQRRQMLVTEARARTKRMPFTRRQRRWLAKKVTKEVDLAARDVALAVKAGDQAQEKLGRDRLDKALQVLG